MQDLHQPGAQLDYSIGGSDAVIQALVRADTSERPEDKTAGKVGKLLLNSHVSSILVEEGRAGDVQLRSNSASRVCRRL